MNLQKRAWQVGIFAGTVLSIYLIALAIGQLKSIAYIGSGVPATNTISVTGTGDTYAVPDVATFSFGVTQTSKTVSDAQTKATDKINAALKAVRDGGVEDKDIQTTNYSINPHYEYQNAICPAKTDGTVAYCPPGKSVLTGYDVSQTITVKVRNLDKAGALFASIGSLQVENINGLSFSVDKPDAIQAEARAKAIADAKSKADQLASQLGVRLVRVISFSEDNGAYYRPMAYGMGGDVAVSTKSAAPEIPTGQQKVTSTVSITYEIQ
ncbi:MAG TPA: SIMPL domain-containing protein [Candidatus Paceibacterota bacterium]|nr:SIMPL domain-containing protein [Candidatus Paceibacterota bacterium]